MDTPASVTVGVVLYAPRRLDPAELEHEAAHAAELCARLGVPKERAFGQAIARTVTEATWRIILARQGLGADTGLLASVHFFDGRPAPIEVASALAVFAHAWLHRREHGTEPPGSLPLSDLPPGPLDGAKVLRDAAPKVNALMLDDTRFAEWMRAYEAAWDEAPSAN